MFPFQCARIQMPLLTLARFILELSLLDYSTITLSDSKQAAAALYLAFRMVKHGDWTDSLVYYTGTDFEVASCVLIMEVVTKFVIWFCYELLTVCEDQCSK